jgi:hypothetical protein
MIQSAMCACRMWKKSAAKTTTGVGEVGRVDGAHAQVQRRVVLLVLERVAALVRGDADAGGGIALVVFRREHELLVDRVVVVAEEAFALDDFHVGDSGPLQNALRGLGPGEARGDRDLRGLRVGALQVRHRGERDEKRQA